MLPSVGVDLPAYGEPMWLAEEVSGNTFASESLAIPLVAASATTARRALRPLA